MTHFTQNQHNWLKQHPTLPFNLPDWGLIMVEGADATSFLQNQLTNSVLGLNPSLPGTLAKGFLGARLVGYCNPKGRLLASAWLGLFPISTNSEDRYTLFISKDIAADVAKRLAMYVLRSKVKVIDLSSLWSITAVYGPSDIMSRQNIPTECLALRLPDILVGSQLLARHVMAHSNETSVITHDSVNHFAAWNALEVLSAIPRIVKATQEQFVPQMINFESVAGIDFKKGCYPGQEIVARSQYRGAIKRRLQLAHISDANCDEQSFLPGAEIFHSNDPEQPAGMVVLSARNPSEPQRIDLQVECKLDALVNGEIHLGNAAGPVLKIDPLPYPLLEI